MALTATQKLQIKRHLGVDQYSVELDDRFTKLDSDADTLAELTDTLTKCETALTAIQTAYDNVDEIASGGGAVFNHNNAITLKKKNYNRHRQNLSRIMQYPILDENIGGARTVGWLQL